MLEKIVNRLKKWLSFTENKQCNNSIDKFDINAYTDSINIYEWMPWEDLNTLQKLYENEFKNSKPSDLEWVSMKIRLISTEINKRKQQLKESQTEGFTSDSYNKLDTVLEKMRNKLKEMPHAFAENGAINANNKVALLLWKEIEKIDQILKKIDSSMGIHKRNIGNYFN